MKGKPLVSRQQQRMLLIGLLAVIIFGIYGVHILRPLWNASRQLTQQLQAGRQHLNALKAAAANEQLLTTQYRELNKTVASLRGALPPEDKLPTIIELLSDLAGQTQVKIQTIFPDRPAATETLASTAGDASRPAPKDVTIQIDAFAGYHQLGAFLSLVESQTLPLRVANLHVSGNAKDIRRHHLKLMIQSYVVAGQGAPPS